MKDGIILIVLLLCVNSTTSVTTRDIAANCSATNCKHSYVGIPKKTCINKGCCWNQAIKKCFEKLSCFHPCKNVYIGAPKSICEKQGCIYNDANNKCYSVQNRLLNNLGRSQTNQVQQPNVENISRIPFTSLKNNCGTKKCAKSYLGIPKHECIDFGCCWNIRDQCMQKKLCKDTYAGEPRSSCNNRGCIFQNADKVCYEGRLNASLQEENAVHNNFPRRRITVSNNQSNLAGNNRSNDVICPLLTPVLHGSYRCSSQIYSVGITCKVFCFPGYYLLESFTLDCMSNGSWRPVTSPKCTAIECPPLKNFVGSCTNGLRYKSECRLSCPYGFTTNLGVNVKRCQSDGRWDNGKLLCRPVECPPLKNFVGSCTNGWRYKSQCRLNCPYGFTNSGGNVKRCQSDGRWDNGKLLCRRILDASSQCLLNINLSNELRTSVTNFNISIQNPKMKPSWFISSSCRYQAAVNINLDTKQILMVALHYSEPSFNHFELISQSVHLQGYGQDLLMLKPEKKTYKNVFVHHHSVILHVELNDKKILYVVQRKNSKKINKQGYIEFSTPISGKIQLGFNRMFHLPTFAWGLCNVCLN